MQNVLVTGSSRGIGKAIAKIFLQNNYNVILNCNKDTDCLEQTLNEFKNISSNVIAVPCDVGSYEAVTGMFDIIRESFGNVDILINNAAIQYFGLFNLMSVSDAEKIISTNLMSVINCSNAAITSMVKKKSGCIINISSIWGSVGASCEAVYSAAKGGVDAFTRSIAKEFGSCNIRVNSIACGVIDTEMNNRLTPEEREELIWDIPLQRLGEPSEIAELCYFLCSDKAKYITGEIIKIDGGFI